MSIPGLNQEKCEQRKRLAGFRLGVEAAPLHFRGSPGVASPDVFVSDDFMALKTEGELPASMNDVMALINSKLPAGSPPLAQDQVYIHFLEAANGNFVQDRSMFLSKSTLQNIAHDSGAGVSFMNSHRTGGLSAPAELPFGQTFSGQYQEGFDAQGNPARRSIVGVYMLRGVRPTGEQGPSTDDLNSMIAAGTIKDVSVGLHGGEKICNVCGNGLFAQDDEGDYLCAHSPGTLYEMTDEEIEAEKQRDPNNKKGVATYTLEDAHQHEVSAVFDGAVPGAGVRKVMSLAHGADLTQDSIREMLQQAYEFYGALLPFDLAEVVEIKPGKFTNPATKSVQKGTKEARNMGTLEKIRALVLGEESSEEAQSEKTPAAAPPAAAIPSATETELRAQLEQLKAEVAESTKRTQEAAATAFAEKYAGKVMPNERESFAARVRALYILASGTPDGIEQLTAMCDAMPDVTAGLKGAALSFVPRGATAEKAPDGKPDAAALATEIVEAAGGKVAKAG